VLSFDIIALNSNAYVTSVKKLFDASHSSNNMLYSSDSALSGLFVLTVIVEKVPWMTKWTEVMGARSSEKAYRVDVTAIPIPCPLRYNLRDKNMSQLWKRDQTRAGKT